MADLRFSAYAQATSTAEIPWRLRHPGDHRRRPRTRWARANCRSITAPKNRRTYSPRLARGLEIPCCFLTSLEAGALIAGAIPDVPAWCAWATGRVTGAGDAPDPGTNVASRHAYRHRAGVGFPNSLTRIVCWRRRRAGYHLRADPHLTPGVEIGQSPLAERAVPERSNPRQDIFVPIDYIIGGPSMAGQGWRMLAECLSVGRGSWLRRPTPPVVWKLPSWRLALRPYSPPVRTHRQMGDEEALARIAGNAYVMDAAASLITYGIMPARNLQCRPLS